LARFGKKFAFPKCGVGQEHIDFGGFCSMLVAKRMNRGRMCHMPRTLLKQMCVRLVTKCCEEAGAELVEAAIVIPLLLMLLLGIFWMGRAYNVYETITRAAREGARYAVLPSCASCTPANVTTETYTSAGTSTSQACVSNPTSNPGLPTAYNSSSFPTYECAYYVAPSLAASDLDPTKMKNYCQQAVVVNPTSPAAAQQCGIQVSFKYPIQLLIPFTSVNATTINIPTSVTMRMENQPFNSTTGAPSCP
jgi:Flp pilus assembly protein TadG